MGPIARTSPWTKTEAALDQIEAVLGQELDYPVLDAALDQTYEFLTTDLASYLSTATDTPLRSQRVRGQGPRLMWVPA